MTGSPKLVCLCGAISAELSVTIPAPTELCHCNPCRLVTGGLAASFVELPKQPSFAVLEKCTTYYSSATHSRLFCSTCGAKLLVHVHHHTDGRERNDWFAHSGVVERAEGQAQPNTTRVDFNKWVEDTVDGGLARYLTHLGGRNVPAYRITESDPPLSQHDLEALPQTAAMQAHTLPGADERLPASCRCGTVKLLIKPADHTNTSIPRPGNIIPVSSSTKEKIPHKYSARVCTCRSCRLAMGVSLTTHTYIPPRQILNPTTGAPLAYGPAIETAEGRAANRGLEAMKYYQRTKAAWRSFCGACGSTIYYWNAERPDIVNIAAGILRAEEGALARRWLYWQPGMVSFPEEAADRDILEAYATADVN